MTYKEFKRGVFTIYNETYRGDDTSPIEYGVERAKFEETKLQRLINMAGQTEFSTAKRKVAGWRRQLERVHAIRIRLEERQAESIILSRSFLTGRAVPLSLATASVPRSQSLRVQ